MVKTATLNHLIPFMAGNFCVRDEGIERSLCVAEESGSEKKKGVTPVLISMRGLGSHHHSKPISRITCFKLDSDSVWYSLKVKVRN